MEQLFGLNYGTLFDKLMWFSKISKIYRTD